MLRKPLGSPMPENQDSPYVPRLIEGRLQDALGYSPVTLIHGPRQCGKTTLARRVGESLGYAYVSFDDPLRLEQARADPVGFVAGLSERTILDEVQRAPFLFSALKMKVDENRTAGRFILSGSSNVLLIPELSDTLAGRMVVLRLHPLAQSELEGVRPKFFRALFSRDFRPQVSEQPRRPVFDRVASGGYPPALAAPTRWQQAEWCRNYVDAVLMREVRELSRIRALGEMPKLLSLMADQTAQVLNVSRMASGLRLSRPATLDYLELLEQVFLVSRLPPWFNSQAPRQTRTPKIHITDTGLACVILGENSTTLSENRARSGHLLETFTLNELRRLASWEQTGLSFYHYRDRDKTEVDIVVETEGGQVAGLEVKAAAMVGDRDFRGLRKLQALAGRKFATGVILYGGHLSIRFGEGLYAVPLRMLWAPAPHNPEGPEIPGNRGETLVPLK